MTSHPALRSFSQTLWDYFQIVFNLAKKKKKKILTRTSSREVIEDRTTEQDKGKWWSGDAEPVARCYAQCCRWLPDSIPEKAIIIIIAFVLAYDVCFWWE